MHRFSLVIQCEAAGCFEGDKEQYMGRRPIALMTEAWANLEKAGWTLQSGGHYCPKHRNYLKQIESKRETRTWEGV